MIQKIGIFFVFLCIASLSAQGKAVLTVAVASSLYPAMQQQATIFEKQHDVSIRLVSGSTGRLYNQIMQGAPFDVFIAADSVRPALLKKQGRVVEQVRFGHGYVGVLTREHLSVSPAQLAVPSIRHIAIANPDVAPFGKITKEVLQKEGLWQRLRHKFVYAQNAMQAKMMVMHGLVDAGFVPVSPDQKSIAVIQYQGVALSDKVIARQWLNSIAAPRNRQLALSRY